MWGSKYLRMVNGDWDHVGTVTATLPAGVTHRMGTHLQYQITGTAGVDIESQAVLASGLAIGFMTQDMDDAGLTSDAAYRNMTLLNLQNLPIKNGSEVSLRRLKLDAELEIEGKGDALPGNLVATTGTGAITTATAVKTELSVFNGAIRVAQSGDFVMYLLENANLTPEAAASNLRIRIRRVGTYKKP